MIKQGFVLVELKKGDQPIFKVEYFKDLKEASKFVSMIRSSKSEWKCIYFNQSYQPLRESAKEALADLDNLA